MSLKNPSVIENECVEFEPERCSCKRCLQPTGPVVILPFVFFFSQDILPNLVNLFPACLTLLSTRARRPVGFNLATVMPELQK